MLVNGFEIAPVDSARDRRDFFRVLRRVYADDPAWSPPLAFDALGRLNPKTNPGLRALDAAMWVARRKGEPVGRISAQINPAFQARHGAQIGHFGHFETVEDGALAKALFEVAERWLVARGATSALGPFNFTINDECGALIDGFDTPPVIMMPHGRPYYANMYEAAGYAKAKDLIAYHFESGVEPPPRLSRIAARVAEDPSVTLRGLDMKNFARDVRTVLDIYNDAWSENWGFVPFSDEEITHAASEMRLLLSPHSLAVAEVDGEPVAFALALPDLIEAARGLDGRLFPFGWARLLYRLKTNRVAGARLPLLGLRREWHGAPLGAALVYAILEKLRCDHQRRGVRWAELSWILEDNRRVRGIIESYGATPYKTYRIYEKTL
ncbi:MAG: protein YghO [Parvularculaceae bacterium]